MIRWIEKKDLVYWIGIILTVTLLNTKYDTTLNQWAFAGTIISIILAVLAIIYSFDQSSTTLYSTRKLEESALKIEEVTNILQGMEVNELLKNIETRMESLDKAIDEKMTTNFGDIKNALKNNIIVESAPKIKSSLMNKEEWEIYIRNSIAEEPKKTGVTVLGLMYAYLCYKKGKQLDIKKFARYLFSDTREQISDNSFIQYESLFDGIIISFHSLGTINVSSELKTINSIDEIFIEVAEKVLAEEKYVNFTREINSLI